MLAGRVVVINETPIEDIVSNTAVETVVKIEENPDYGQFTVYTNYESFGAVSEDEYPFVDKS